LAGLWLVRHNQTDQPQVTFLAKTGRLKLSTRSPAFCIQTRSLDLKPVAYLSGFSSS
jgi:hypothetical protein